RNWLIAGRFAIDMKQRPGRSSRADFSGRSSRDDPGAQRILRDRRVLGDDYAACTTETSSWYAFATGSPMSPALSRTQIGEVWADRLWWRALVLAYVEPR